MSKLQYTQLSYLAFRPNEQKLPLVTEFQAAYLPRSWHSEGTRLWEEYKRSKGAEHWQIPVSALDNLLMACVPGVTVASNDAWRKPEEKAWLYLSRRLQDGAILHRAMRRWARHRLMGDAYGEDSDVALAEMFQDNLLWNAVALNPVDYKFSVNQTASPRQDYAYRLIPNLIAERIARFPFEIGGQETQFYRAPRPQSDRDGSANAVELIEWPPRRVRPGISRDYWSLVLTISVQTAPFQSFVSVHCNLSVRRWVDVGINESLGRQRNVRAYLFYNSPDGDSCFLVTRAIRQRNNGNWDWLWTDRLKDLLPAIGLRHGIPAPPELIANPLEHLEVGAAGVVYTHYMQQEMFAYRRREHRGGTGFGPSDRYRLSQLIAERLAPDYEPLTPSPFCSIPSHPLSFSKNPLRHNLQCKAKEEPGETSGDKTKSEPPLPLFEEARSLIGEQAGGSLKILILYQEPRKAQMITQILCDCIGFSAQAHPVFSDNGKDEGEYTWATANLSLTIAVQRLGNMGDGDWGTPLTLPEAGEDNTRKHNQAVYLRAEKIRNSAPAPEGVCGALVEIEPASRYTNTGGHDPKDAIRLGLAKADWVTQFFVQRPPADTPKREKVERQAIVSAVFDLLRQMGICPPVKVPKAKARQNTLLEWDYVGFVLLKKSEKCYLPVCVRMNLSRAEVMATARGLPSWLPYEDFLPTLTRSVEILQPITYKTINHPDVFHFIRFILDEQAKRGDTLVLFHKNSFSEGGLWQWMNNDQITRQDKVVLGNTEYPVYTHWDGKIRVAWVRDAGDNYQIPQCYTLDDHGHYEYGGGLFSVSDRFFRSVANKPTTQKGRRVETSKYESGTRRSGKRKGELFSADPTDHAWNPIPVEILIAAKQESDEAVDLVWAVHQLRSAFIHYEDQTRLPAPLHLAKQAEEYYFPFTKL
jgi:hypothetical protein